MKNKWKKIIIIYIIIGMIIIINTIQAKEEKKRQEEIKLKNIIKEGEIYEIKIEQRKDKEHKGEGKIKITREEGIQLILEDKKTKQKHQINEKTKKHIITYETKEMERIMKNIINEKGREKNILCQKIERNEKNILEKKIERLTREEVEEDIIIKKKCKGKKTYGIEIMGRYIVICKENKKEEEEQKINIITSTFEGTITLIKKKKKKNNNIINEKKEETCEKGILQRAIAEYIEEQQQQKKKEQKEEGKWFMKKKRKEKRKIKTETKKTCIFLHGVGEWTTGPTTNTFPDYWGNIEKYTTHCKEHKFIHQETKYRGWNDESLQKAYCELMLEGNEPGDRVVRNKILYVHSMGNLIVPAAIRSGMCTIDKTTTAYYNVQGPYQGSIAANFIKKVCANNDTNPVYREIAKLGGYCIKDAEEAYPAYLTLAPDFPEIKGLKEIALQFQTGAMCGTSPLGLYTPYSVLYLLSKIVNYTGDNDGMVPIGSCVAEGQKFEEDFSSDYYAAKCNHADGTCRSGDGWWNRGRAPCSWYSQRF
mmetsp:Transcript_1204/g.1833  ORF Transcript_1204/g.1833 Transcript_1204/m.1833 type:complete len:535 (+) Transcript_1204:34-1638(+)